MAVVRYFGGIKLGAGGLTRAYSGGAAAVLSVAKAMKYTVCRRYSAVVPYSFLKTAKNSPRTSEESTIRLSAKLWL